MQYEWQDTSRAQEAWERAEEDFEGTDLYKERYEDWVASGNEGTEEEWEETCDYELAVESYMWANSYE